MKPLSIPAGTYVLLRLEDLEYVQTLGATQDDYYLDVWGPDAADVVSAVVPTASTITVLPTGRIRIVLNDHPYKLNYQRIVDTAISHQSSTGRQAHHKIGSFRWVGHLFEGHESLGVVEGADPNTRRPVTMIHLDEATELALGKPEPKRTPKPRRRAAKAPASAK